MANQQKEITIGILGFGRFGALAASVLKQHAEVVVFELNQDEAIQHKAKVVGVPLVSKAQAASSDLVILCAPISKTEQLIKDIAPEVRPEAVVLDTSSVKIHPCQWLQDHLPQSVEIMGSHPMFGPVTTQFDLENQSWQLTGLQIVLCPIRISRTRQEHVERFLRLLGLHVIITTPDDHDRQNALTLSLVHFVGRALNATGVKPQRIFTPGFTDLLKILPHTNSDDWQLFYDMHLYNPYAKGVREDFITACQQLDEKIQNQAGENYEL